MIIKKISSKLLFLGLCLTVFFVSCKDDNDDFKLSDSRIEINLNGTAILTVSGAGDFQVSVSNENIIEYEVNANKLQISAIGEGTTTLTVTASNGLKESCLVIVRENKEDLSFQGDPTVRIEKNENILNSEKIDGFLFSVSKGEDAFNGRFKSNVITFEYSTLNNLKEFCRLSASGDFSKKGDLSDGLVIIQKRNNLEYYRANKVVLKQIKNNQLYIIFYLPDNITVRIVTDEL